MTTINAPAARTRPGADTKERPSVHEPTYLVPRPLLFAVQATGDEARKASRRLSFAIHAGERPWRVAALRDELNAANLAYQCAVLIAASEGATSAELIGYGVSRDLAAEIDRRAAQ